jgi:multidrug resistance protein, MATE family
MAEITVSSSLVWRGRRSAISEIGKLALPVLFVQIPMVGNSVVDTIMAGRRSALDLAAVGIGAAIYITVFVIAHGFLLAAAPMFVKLNGVGKLRELGRSVVQVSWVSMLIAFPCSVLLWNAGRAIHWITQIDEAALLAGQYLKGCAMSLPAILWFRVFYAISTAVGRTTWVFLITGVAALLKIPINGALMYGVDNVVPPLGAAGCGVALLIVPWTAALVSVPVLARATAYRRLKITWRAPDRKTILAFLQLGVPISIMQTAEIVSVAAMGRWPRDLARPKWARTRLP